ncbi:MAG: hypothetical protein C3F02_03710 [Parcubacteria group bacterium]|nr:MAG: hypothetical protein C3F02_03710 [Parcubacteria group bacterium]
MVATSILHLSETLQASDGGEEKEVDLDYKSSPGVRLISLDSGSQLSQEHSGGKDKKFPVA